MLNTPPNVPGVLPTAMGGQEEKVTAAQDSTYFESDYAYEQFPQRIGDVNKHRYFQIFTIGVATGPQNAQSISPGLTVGAFQRIIAEQEPEIWIISVSSKAGGGTIQVWDGEPGGPFIPLGLGGYAVIPARSMSLSLQAVGATAVGVVIALGGFSAFANPSPQINVGAF